MAAWEVGAAFQNNNADALMNHIGDRAVQYGISSGVPNVRVTYLYVMEQDARNCVADGNFARLNDWNAADRSPVFGPIGPCNWFLAVPYQWCQDNARNVQTIHNAADFPVIAWGRVILRVG